VTSSELQGEFERLQRAHQTEPYPTLAVRRAWLDALQRLLTENRDALAHALAEDFGHRSLHESLLSEIWLPLSQIRHLRSRLAGFMKPVSKTPLWVLRPGRARVVYQPKGVVGIISPWNYPVMLAVSPLAGALAAGNRVLLKLSEHVPKTSALLAELLRAALPSDVVSVVLGGPEVGQAFAELKFDHLLFTGGTAVGQKVARAAAANLVPLTLELGGKCPAILHADYSVERFAERVIPGKCFSAGQSCVAPDYLLVPRGSEAAVVEALRARFASCFATLRDNPDYTAVATPERKRRLLGLKQDAVDQGARAIELNPASESFADTQKLPLTLLLDVPDAAQISSEEIFGPLLPIIPYDTLDLALQYVNARPRPLALYYFDSNDARVRHVLEHTISGGVTINDTLLHFLCDELPREGTGESGHGAYFGRTSFETFSHKKSVFTQSRLSASGTFSPPYGKWVQWMLDHVLVGRR
jgi:coniferyl-aldehyde dehydrogenase